MRYCRKKIWERLVCVPQIIIDSKDVRHFAYQEGDWDNLNREYPGVERLFAGALYHESFNGSQKDKAEGRPPEG